MNNYDIWFCQARISNKNKLKLIKKFKDTKKIWYYISNNININSKKFNVWNERKFNEVKYVMDKENIKYTTYFDEDYPYKLKKYDDSPYILFYKGNIKKLNYGKNVSIVGARNCTYYGIQCTKYITKQLTLNNVNIISGMAYGIDGFAHSTCIQNGGYTCAVLGSGVNVIYPKRNTKLYHEILKKGCIISEFLPGTIPYSYNFPLRNRIISALCDILIVIEAGEKSGSLITANYALNQGKDIVAVPGSIFSDKSKGTNLLIHDGAFPFTDMNNLFKLLDINSKNSIQNSKTKNSMQSPLYKKIYELIGDTPIHIDDLLRLTEVDITHLYELLFEMQLNKQIFCLSGNYYVKNHDV